MNYRDKNIFRKWGWTTAEHYAISEYTDSVRFEDLEGRAVGRAIDDINWAIENSMDLDITSVY